MKGPELLKENAGRLRTRMGACFPGNRAVFRGHDLHAELKDMDWLELYVFGITGQRFPPAQLRLLHALWVYTSYPDARIWNNRVAALAGSTRSACSLGLAAALAVSDASIYGGGIIVRAAIFFGGARQRLESGTSLGECIQQELETQRSIAGYGRPIASGDERILPTLSLSRSLGLDQGPHLRLALEVEQVLLAGRWRMRMNYGALAAALLTDLGLAPQQIQAYVFPAFLAGMAPCFLEAEEHPEGALFPLSCAHIGYEGAAKRSWR